jgi:WD40 repeat protein
VKPLPGLVRTDKKAPKDAPPAVKTWQRHGDPIEAHILGTCALTFTPDGTRVLTGGSLFKDAELQGEWCTWDPKTGKRDAYVEAPIHGYAIHAAAFSPDGKLLATVCQTGKVVVWNTPPKDTISYRWDATAHADNQCRAVAFGPDGKWLVTAGSDGKVRRWDAANGKSEFEETPNAEDKLWSVAISPDGKTVAAAGNSGTVYFLDPKTGKVTAKHEKHSGSVLSLAFTRDGKTIISNAQDKEAKVWDVATGTVRHTLSNDYGSDCAMALSADGTRLAVTGKSGTEPGVRIYDLGTGKEVALLETKLKWIVELAFSPDGKTLAVGGTLPPKDDELKSTSKGGLEFWVFK